MREHHLYVMSLEEFPPNREFVGRNFNAGEVIQLVLKSPATGRWLPFEYVQMVMMHELAHCKQMNHSRAFWAVRNAYASQMQGLWSQGYAGDGLWGRGAKLETGAWEGNTVRAGEVLPEHLCGGTYRSRRRKRKAKPVLSYQERKQRRIEKKFGKHGLALGSDEETKVKLENGKKVKGKPRVAGSARGRELRAAAALARFEQQKEVKTEEVKEEEETDSGSESDNEAVELDGKDALDLDGSRLVDDKGRGLVKVCEDEDEADPEANKELQELQDVFRRKIKQESPDTDLELVAVAPSSRGPSSSRQQDRSQGTDTDLQASTSNGAPDKAIKKQVAKKSLPPDQTTLVADNSQVKIRQREKEKVKVEETPSSSHNPPSSKACPVCSFENPRSAAVTCSMCANVLDPTTTPGAWKCPSHLCKDSKYWNSADCGICGLCGKKRP